VGIILLSLVLQVSAASPLAIGETFTIDSKALGESRRINVYRPSPYGLAPDAPLPVLYMPDGGLQEDFLHVAGLVQVLTGNGGMRPFLLVGIENTERRRDLTGPTSNAEDRRIAPRPGGSAKFRTFIRDELMPAIHARYETTSETAIVGESLAGLFVIETLVVEPSLFDTYIAFDPSLWWNDSALVSKAGGLVERLTGKKLYVAVSRDGDRADAVNRFVTGLAGLTPARLALTHAVLDDETHATVYHPAALRAFRVLFPVTDSR